MATLKQRLHKKNSSGSYDIVHLETSASLVLMSDGTDVETAIKNAGSGEHTQSASTITTGTFAGQVNANSANVANIGITQLRNIYAGTTDLTDGVSALATGDIYIVYE